MAMGVKLWPRDLMLREQHLFVEATMLMEKHNFLMVMSLMCKQICMTIATWHYRKWILLMN